MIRPREQGDISDIPERANGRTDSRIVCAFLSRCWSAAFQQQQQLEWPAWALNYHYRISKSALEQAAAGKQLMNFGAGQRDSNNNNRR